MASFGVLALVSSSEVAGGRVGVGAPGEAAWAEENDLRTGVGCRYRSATKRSNSAIASAAVAMTGGANSALKEFHLTGLTGAGAGILGRD
jgi:hypothetical protein